MPYFPGRDRGYSRRRICERWKCSNPRREWKAGKPIGGEHLQVWVNGRRGTALTLVTGKNGIAVLEAPPRSLIEVESNYYRDCRPFEKSTTRPTYSTAEIMSAGVAAPNTCGRVNSEATRGELLFFVRPFSVWEGMRR